MSRSPLRQVPAFARHWREYAATAILVSSPTRSHGPNSAGRSRVWLWPRKPSRASKEYKSRKQSWSSLWSLVVYFEFRFQIVQEGQALLLEFPHPTPVNFVERDRIDEMQLLSAPFYGADEVSRFENSDVLGDRLSSHVEMLAQVPQRSSVPLA